MSGRTAKVKSRAKSRHHKNPGGSFRGTYVIGPSSNWSGRRCASIKNAPSTPGQQQTSSAKKTRSDTQGNLADRGRTGKDHHESRHDRDIVVWSQKETEKIKDSFMLRAARKNNRPQRRRCGTETGRENLTSLLNLTVSQCDFARVWTVSTVKPTSRGAEEIQHLRPNNTGQRGRINQAQLWSERLERRMRSKPGNRDEARTRRKSGDLARKPPNQRPKGTHRSHVKSWGKRATTPGGNATLQVRRASKNF